MFECVCIDCGNLESVASADNSPTKEIILSKDSEDTPSALASMNSSNMESDPKSLRASVLEVGANSDKQQSTSGGGIDLDDDLFKVEVLAEPLPTTEATSPADSLSERDYDVGPTPLYTALQKKKWSNAISILEQSPDEARTWVYRKESQGVKIRWRLLPIHGAIIFQAPPEVVESILLIFPECAAERDDEGSLPIHLAYKRGAGASVCKLLLDAFPNSIDIADRKGRTPKHLAASSNGPKHREFVYAMKNHLLALRAARVAARAEERLKFSAKLDAIKKEHEENLKALEKKKTSEQETQQQKIKELEEELLRTQEASQVLVDHVTAMEEKAAQKEEEEKHLKVKVETLEEDLEQSFKDREEEESKMKKAIDEQEEEKSKLKNVIDNLQKELEGLKQEFGDAQVKVEALEESLGQAFNDREELEGKMKEESSSLNTELADIQEHVNHLLLEKEVLNKSLDEVVAGAELEKKALEGQIAANEQQISKLSAEKEHALADIILLKDENKKRSDNEEALTEDKEALDTKLKEQAATHLAQSTAAQERFNALDKDCGELKMTVGTLSQKLRTVAGFLDDMTNEQDAIVEQAAVHEAEMKAAGKEHTRILEEVNKQQELDSKAQEARDVISKLIRQHEASYLQNVQGREHVVDSIDKQMKTLNESATKRKELVQNVKSLREKIKETKSQVLGGLPELEKQQHDKTKEKEEQPSPESQDQLEESRYPTDEFVNSQRTEGVETREDDNIGTKIAEIVVESEPPRLTPKSAPTKQQRAVFEEEKKTDDSPEMEGDGGTRSAAYV